MVKKVKKTKNAPKNAPKKTPKKTSKNNPKNTSKNNPKNGPKKKSNKFEIKSKNQARRYLKSMVEKYDFDNNPLTFSEYLESKRKDSEKINQIVIEAKLDSDSVMSLTNFLEDNDFSDDTKDLLDEDYTLEKKETNKKATKKVAIDGPLSGKIIVLSGSLLIDKDDLKAILTRLGAKVTSSVSGKTNILIHGDYLEDGRRYTKGKKYKTAKELNTEIYSDKEFEAYMEQLLNKEWKMKEELEKINSLI